MNANTIDKLKKLCELNPSKCSKIRPELCVKMFILNGYPKIPEDPCKMYIDIVNSVKSGNPKKKLVDISIKPGENLFKSVSLFGNKQTRDFIMSCGYNLPKIINSTIRKVIYEDLPNCQNNSKENFIPKKNNLIALLVLFFNYS